MFSESRQNNTFCLLFGNRNYDNKMTKETEIEKHNLIFK